MRGKWEEEKMKQETLNVNGMSCQHCVNNVTRGLTSISGVEKVEVSLANKTVVVNYNEELVELNQIKEKIERLGYSVK